LYVTAEKVFFSFFFLSQLVESCAQIAGACLEQTTWLRRNLAVREEEPAITVGTNEKEGSGGLILRV
jgi:hypothetical protein